MVRNTNFISIIICSKEKQIRKDLSDNIQETIGCNFELIVIDNSGNKYSIFQAYNLGIEKCTGNFVCFLHDDIMIHTLGWGNIIPRIFDEDPQIGLIGIAGSKIKTKMPSGWWDCPEDQKVINIIQHIPNKEKEKWQIGFEKYGRIEVVAIDGVFMALRKDKRIHFNHEISGFHNYDLNISFEYIKHGYKLIVTKEILVEHFSLGTLNEAWINSTFKLHVLYQSILPLRCPRSEINKETEITNAIKFINKSLIYNNIKVAISTWLKLFYFNPISKYHISFWRTIKNNHLN